ncbi:YncE family protein [Mycobacterium sp. Marseille-P9652]|uniref:YncE family protein n=1 Tax=Mycobacterium sp. Marseille-P9652 TaxID=2654950 RepID=UPI0012E78A14|nr:YncE family protein [Mycobacterium sp. Marseille-P9652]
MKAITGRAAVNGCVVEFDGASAVRVAVGNGPISDIVASPDGGRLFVTNYADDSVSVIDTATWQVTDTVPGLTEPYAIATGRRGDARAYVSTVSPGYDAVTVIDGRSGDVIATHALAFSVSDIAVSPDGARVYVGRNGADGCDVAVLDPDSGLIESVKLPGGPHTTLECVSLSADGTRLYAATNGPSGGRVVVVRTPGTRRVVDTVEIGLPVRDVALSPDGATVHVASCAPELGAVVDTVDTRTHKITGTHKLGDLGIVTGLTLSGDGERAYLVSDTGITVLCALTHDILGTVATGEGPSRVIEAAHRLCVADYAGWVTVVPVGPDRQGPVAAPAWSRREPALV